LKKLYTGLLFYLDTIYTRHGTTVTTNYFKLTTTGTGRYNQRSVDSVTTCFTDKDKVAVASTSCVEQSSF